MLTRNLKSVHLSRNQLVNTSSSLFSFRELIPLSTSVKEPRQSLDYAVWGPTGTQLAFVYEHNLYYKSSVNDPSVQLTRDGNLSTIRNAVPDWLYEEEILGEEKALWWSTNGSRLCFAKFDDSQVDTIDFQIYDDLMPKTASVRYPRVSLCPKFHLFLISQH